MELSVKLYTPEPANSDEAIINSTPKASILKERRRKIPILASFVADDLIPDFSIATIFRICREYVANARKDEVKIQKNNTECNGRDCKFYVSGRIAALRRQFAPSFP